MKKIPSLFKRDYEGTRLVYDEVVPGSEWVIGGEGIATVKFDGTACLVRDGKLYKRYDVKKGRTPPEGWEPCEDAPNEQTGHWPGWLPVGDAPEDKYHLEALQNAGGILPDGTYELVGPKIRSSKQAPYSLERHELWRHGAEQLPDAPRTFEALRVWFTEHPQYEGIVWHHPDGRMVKIKRRDFGLPWPTR